MYGTTKFQNFRGVGSLQFTPSVLCALPHTQRAGLLLNKRTEVIACILRSTETTVIILHGSDDNCVISTERLVELQTTNH